MNIQKNEVVITAPKSLRLFLIQYMSMPFFAAAIAILIVVITSNVSSTLNDILIIWFVFILPLLIVGFFMLYFPQRYKTFMAFDREKQILRKINRRTEVQRYNIRAVKSVISKTIKTNSGCKHLIILKDIENNSYTVFDENIPFGPYHWEKFSENLSKILDLSLKKESETSRI